MSEQSFPKKLSDLGAFGIDTRGFYRALHSTDSANITAIDSEARAADAAFYANMPLHDAQTDPTNITSETNKAMAFLEVLKKRGKKLQEQPNPTNDTPRTLSDHPLPPPLEPASSQRTCSTVQKVSPMRMLLEYPFICPKKVVAIFQDLYNWDCLAGDSAGQKIQAAFVKNSRFEYFMSVLIIIVFITLIVKQQH